MTLDQIKEQLKEIEKMLDSIRVLFPVGKLQNEKILLEQHKSAPDFYNDRKTVEKVGKEIARIDSRIQKIQDIELNFKNIQSLVVDCDENDTSILADIEPELKELQNKTESMQLEGLFTSKYDHLGAILTIQSGAGGTEAQDWAEMLLRMYERYIAKQGYKLQILDITDGESAGIKGVTIRVEGENAYGYLKSESGVHRLVRISPFDSNSRRHTSFASVEVMPEIEYDNESNNENENNIQIKPEDLKIDVFRSGGNGGQGVNTTDSAVRIHHIPTGIIVQCQNERSQIQNRENALSVLRSRLVHMEELKRQADLHQIQGKLKKIEWGSQIRSYVFCPYTMVKDHRTDWETSDVQGFMDGNIQECIEDYLKSSIE